MKIVSVIVVFILSLAQFANANCNVKCTNFASSFDYNCNSNIKQYQITVPSINEVDIYSKCAEEMIPLIKRNDSSFNSFIASYKGHKPQCLVGAGTTRKVEFGIIIESVNCDKGGYLGEIITDPIRLTDADIVGDCKQADLSAHIRFGFMCNTSNQSKFTFNAGTWFTPDRRAWTRPITTNSLADAENYCGTRGKRLPTRKEWEFYQKTYQIDEVLTPGGRSAWFTEEQTTGEQKPVEKKSDNRLKEIKVATCIVN